MKVTPGNSLSNYRYLLMPYKRTKHNVILIKESSFTSSQKVKVNIFVATNSRIPSWGRMECLLTAHTHLGVFTRFH